MSLLTPRGTRVITKGVVKEVFQQANRKKGTDHGPVAITYEVLALLGQSIA